MIFTMVHFFCRRKKLHIFGTGVPLLNKSCESCQCVVAAAQEILSRSWGTGRFSGELRNKCIVWSKHLNASSLVYHQLQEGKLQKNPIFFFKSSDGRQNSRYVTRLLEVGWHEIRNCQAESRTDSSLTSLADWAQQFWLPPPQSHQPGLQLKCLCSTEPSAAPPLL